MGISIEQHAREIAKLCSKHKLEMSKAADALVQKQATIDELIESLDEAKYDEPELRSKLDKQRQLFTAHTAAVEKFLSELAPYLGLDGDSYKPRDLITAAEQIRQWCADSNDERGKQRERIQQLEKQVYLAGHWSCPKCNFYLVSTNMHVPSGGFSANKKPQACANGCGPMWRVTHEQSANTMVDCCETQTTRIEQLEAALKVYENIVSDSSGVDGYHLNGDIALWDEFELPQIAGDSNP